MPSVTRVAALCGGVGAAKMLRGAVRVVDPAAITAIVNVGDDATLHGLRICPDLDTVMYTVSGSVNDQTGWGLVDETWSTMTALARFAGRCPAGSEAADTWFRLGDKDLATHLYRTDRLREGAFLSAVTSELAAAFELGLRLLPVSDDEVSTRILPVEGGQELSFQEWFVGRQHQPRVAEVRFEGAERSSPAPGVIEALQQADRVVICPSNPAVSIAPLLAVPGVAAAVRARRQDTVAVSPIVAGAALKGPAASLLIDLGHDSSVVGVARLYQSLAATLVVDEADRDLAEEVEANGMRCVVAPTVMSTVEAAADLVEVVLGC